MMDKRNLIIVLFSVIIVGLVVPNFLGSVSLPVDSAIPPTNAFYTFRANGTDVIADSFDDVINFISSDSTILISGTNSANTGSNPFNDYGYKKLLTLNSSMIEDDFTDYPVLIDITDSDLRHTSSGGKVQSVSGYDIVFTDDTQVNQLPHEVERWNATSGELTAWVSTDIFDIVDTEIYVVFGNSGISSSQENLSGVWNSIYQGVYHLDGDGVDSSQYSRDATNSGATSATGKIANAMSFDGISDYLDLGSSETFWYDGDISFTTLAYTNDLTTDHGVSGQWKGQPANDVFFWFIDDNHPGSGKTDVWVCGAKTDTGGTPFLRGETSSAVQGTWQHITCVYDFGDSNGQRLFIDGTEVTDSPDDLSSYASLNQPASPIDTRIGDTNNRNVYWDGMIDEIRFYGGALSGDYITTEANMLLDNPNFVSVGALEVFLQEDEIDFTLAAPSETSLGGVYATECAPDSVTGINSDGTVDCGTGDVDATVPRVIKHHTFAIATSIIDITSIPPYEFLELRGFLDSQTATAYSTQMTFNNDTNNNYGWRTTDDTNIIEVDSTTTSGYDRSFVMNILNSPDHNKVGTASAVLFTDPNADIDTTTSSRFTYNGTGMIQSIKFNLNGFNSWTADSYITILGWNSTS